MRHVETHAGTGDLIANLRKHLDCHLADADNRLVMALHGAIHERWCWQPASLSRLPGVVVRYADAPDGIEGAAERFDQARTLCRQAGFQGIAFRGDTDFSQTHLTAIRQSF